ncbi:DUF5681 domain-containing protein [Allosphingosinicella deserti]|uniref:DUF5681 domain-containing protein n=1 Tax=Allosphingosinicella deserti TaxID=2116704 RepID=A0A2P7QNM1_9SPHN|nr:DUF5681 domain-containing protein [Sphingomonas deserti]PSJ39540.1 hypothetical protein C7I55_13110 [Sphingomonas deserti]
MTDLSSTPTRAASGRFLPGRSGNPAGRPPGSRNRSSLLIEQIDEADSAAIVKAVVDRALSGHWPAQRACLTRLFAPAKEAPIALDLPAVASAADVAAAGTALIAALAAGDVTPGEAQKVMAVLAGHLKALDAARREGARETAPVEAGAPLTTTEPAVSPAERPCILPVVAVAAEDSAARHDRPSTRGAARPSPSGEHAAADACNSPVLSSVEGAVAETPTASPEYPGRVERGLSGGTETFFETKRSADRRGARSRASWLYERPFGTVPARLRADQGAPASEGRSGAASRRSATPLHAFVGADACISPVLADASGSGALPHRSQRHGDRGHAKPAYADAACA